ncbi:phosphoribosyl-AMP cyclohydrolase [Methyloligella solikamskensis]|uniref:Phosphoribosyl-AMP cyclohydrolase n=1 Tax=Methyloligella solikamskensis TaxID=1177756 RepID=A0ABW3J965_9HYPH
MPSPTKEGTETSATIEETRRFSPKFGPDGTLPAVAVCATTGEVLMLAYMNQEALDRTLETGEAHYFSRSRGKLWKKGETSGNVQKVLELRTDCDQDAVLMKVEMVGSPAACHTGRRSCFYRVAPIGETNGELRFADAERLFDPKKVYGK